MKIYYKAIVRSINTDQSIFIKNIISELDKPGYIIENQTQNCIKFKYNVWRFSSRGEVFRRIDGGVFEINAKNKITFSYYISPQLEVIATLIASFFGITQDHNIFFFVAFIAIMFIIRVISVKIVANRMMENILNGDLS